MTIRKITIENIKGISSCIFDLNITPNRPSLLVAPNGFGKSSFAAAFMSLQSNKISVHDDHTHKGDASHIPKLIIEYEDEHGAIQTLEANNLSNAINNNFDCFVINNQIKAKGIGRAFGGRTNITASLAINPVILIDTIPNREDFDYSISEQKNIFGNNGKILPNISNVFSCRPLILRISENYMLLDRILGTRTQSQIDIIRQELNNLAGTTDFLRQWLTDNKLATLESIDSLKQLADIISCYDLGHTTKAEAYLSAIQITATYNNDKSKFKSACKYSNYLMEKNYYSEMLSSINTSWCRVLPREDGRKLIVEFPNANHISNGQRDVLTFISLLYKAQRRLRGENSILIIDEVFDYLDDANLVAVQYYITKMIEQYRIEKRRIYPLILTHLNPYYFKSYAFSKQKVYFLDKKPQTANAGMINLLKNRDHATIKDDVSKILLHHHTDAISKRNEFRSLRLPETWGESNNFESFINKECHNYLNGQAQYDPLAVCCSVRKRIEKVVFDKITDTAHKQTFLNTFKTRDKLNFAESIGISVPEFFYLLGIIYNDGMHWHEGQDNISPIAAKLDNKTIQHLINKLFA